MTDLKKIGLSALAGSLVAFSANAGELSVSGGAKFTYTADTGNEDAQDDGSRFGMQQLMSFTGSGELDNGHTVSLGHFMTSAGGASSSTLTYDMGDMGSLTYQDSSGDLGIGKIDDVMPTADEEPTNGLETAAETTPGGKVDGGITGFNYNVSYDMVTINAGYSPKSSSAKVDDGSNSGTGGLKSATSVAIQISAMDGLDVYAGMGSKGNSNGTTEDDHSTAAIKYAFGPVTAGYQISEIDPEGDNNNLDTDSYGIAFAVNENLSISYGYQEMEEEGNTVEQEVKGYSVGYSMGGISIKAHTNEGKNLGNATETESEHTEVAVSFAF